MFGRPFAKRFALCYRTVVCLSDLSVTLVYCGPTVGWIMMKLDTVVRGLGQGHIMLDGDPAPARGHSPQISACLLWPNGWCVRILLGTDVGLDPGDIVLDGDLAPP